MSKSKKSLRGRAAKTVIISLIVTLVFGALYFYLTPAAPQSAGPGVLGVSAPPAGGLFRLHP